MLRKITDIALTASLVMGFTASAASALNRHQMHEMGAFLINSAGYACEGVNAMAPAEADHVYKVRCGAVSLGNRFSINARTGEVWKVTVGPQ
ncbi:hypothetical protein GGQ68_000848 [Sagittula marina]|uniref:Uncharacterized protein n=1 Tax=Sagittula marina TaxID=943940 RepID=A0A7W6DKP7_9RHOB|nr:hypothetical protein [Sagittula marina]MBB3984532.1 hypothetical protein [Sagittula marina]